ncbi:MAG: 16S rRNA (uracil(1498)-N(3))-methyltransferase, partial [Clostridiales bacterium]|nr:16S rRNA (uracil(1498)-N(3))-methyltransferase [Clostridiales bacterium]
MKTGDVLIVSDLSAEAPTRFAGRPHARIPEISDFAESTATEYEARIERITQTEAVLSVLSVRASTREPQTQITLYQGLPKGQKLELVVQKSIELGAHRIVPVRTKRAVPERTDAAAAKKTERLRRIAAETVKQCQRGIVPQVESPISFEEMLREFAENQYDLTIALYELEERRSLKLALKEALPAFPASPSIAVVVGPEGGLECAEAEALQSAGAELVTVGRTVLRTETAGPAAIAMIRYELEL